MGSARRKKRALMMELFRRSKKIKLKDPSKSVKEVINEAKKTLKKTDP